MRRAIKLKERTLMPMKPMKMGGDEDEDDEGVDVESAEAAAELLGEGDVEDMVTVGLVNRVAPLHHG
jgi:hypothetical protein